MAIARKFKRLSHTGAVPAACVTAVLLASGHQRRRLGNLAIAMPGLRTYDPNDPTTALHKRYHDGTIQYTMDNYDWVEGKRYQEDVQLNEAERAAVKQEARKRLSRWPHLEFQDMDNVKFQKGSQKFCSCSPGVDTGDPEDHVFVVSLSRRPTRLRHALGQLHSAQISATIIAAADGDALESQQDLKDLGVHIMPEYEGHKNHNMPFTTGEVGCFLSHYTIWHHMVEYNIPSALILEDDFDFQADFAKRLGTYLQEVAHEPWDILYVGRSPMENDVRSASEHIVEPGYTLWTVGYILRLSGARALLDSNAEKHMVPLDDFFSVAMGLGMDGQYNERAIQWGRHIQPILRGLGTNPPLVMPYVGSMFLSDTAMLRKGTRYVRDLPESGLLRLRRNTRNIDSQACPTAGLSEELSEELTGSERADHGDDSADGMRQAWRDALDTLDRFTSSMLSTC